jgi:hypothetical protein
LMTEQGGRGNKRGEQRHKPGKEPAAAQAPAPKSPASKPTAPRL